jgi:hypothetical protein
VSPINTGQLVGDASAFGDVDLGGEDAPGNLGGTRTRLITDDQDMIDGESSSSSEEEQTEQGKTKKKKKVIKSTFGAGSKTKAIKKKKKKD